MVAFVRISFLFNTREYLIVCAYHILFIHSFVLGLLPGKTLKRDTIGAVDKVIELILELLTFYLCFGQVTF